MLDGYLPAKLSEALDMMAECDCIPFAGGTDLMVQHARGSGVRPCFDKTLLFVSALKELKTFDLMGKTLRIGAAVTLSELLENAATPQIFKEILRQMAAAPTRHMATLAGNICNASPAGDTLPYLYAMDAEVILQSRNETRVLPVADFITAPKRTQRKNDELLTGIRIPAAEFNVESYRKLGQRKGMSLTKASFLGLASTANGRIEDIRIALGSVAPHIVRSRKIESKLTGKNIKDIPGILQELQKDYSALIRPIDDARSTAAYRKQVSLRLIRDFLINCMLKKYRNKERYV
ncbi:MAG: FAD binding domain-containing protein [Candidatus Neomarinimicrobiota bacterium]